MMLLVLGDVERLLDGDVAAGRFEFAEEPRQRRQDAQIVEDRRPQLRRHPAHFGVPPGICLNSPFF